MDIKDIESLVADNTAVLLYFYNDNCAPCKILRPKVQELVQDNFPRIEFRLINAEQHPALSAQHGVFASPTLIVFFEGKEYIRESKNISISELHDKIERIYNMIF
ncbi:MAG: thioredoxin family protein [Bacteroidales bacterium]|nr:thioredoxin family protein [Bacteroidales bacterium]